MICERPRALVGRLKLALFLGFGTTGLLSATTSNLILEFVEPERFSDAELDGHGAKARERTLKELRTHLESLAGKYLKPGQSLRIEVLDLDLAGRFEPWHVPLNDVRYLREVTWPRIELQYELREGETTIRSAKENVSDQNYLMRPQARSSTDPLQYDKAMLDDWFRKRFAAK